MPTTKTTRACTGCGRRTTTARCLACGPSGPRYDHRHRARRTLLLPHAYDNDCPLCQQPMTRSQALDLDHTTNAITHASCNRRAGAAITNGAAEKISNANDYRGIPRNFSRVSEVL